MDEAFCVAVQFLQASLNRRRCACAPRKLHVGADIVSASPTLGAYSARPLWLDCNAIPDFDGLYVRSDVDHFPSKFVSKNERRGDCEDAIFSCLVIVQISSAEASCSGTYLYLMW